MNAPDKAAEIKAAAAALIAFGTALFGWVGWMVVLWLTALLLDYLTGTFAALYNKSWSSAAARQGLWHKLGSIVGGVHAVVDDLMAHRLDDLAQRGFDQCVLGSLAILIDQSDFHIFSPFIVVYQRTS